MTTKEPKSPIPYKVRDKVTGDVIYASARSRHQARSFAAHNRFDVSPLSVADAIKNGVTQKDILDATGELSADQAALDLRPKQS